MWFRPKMKHPTSNQRMITCKKEIILKGNKNVCLTVTAVMKLSEVSASAAAWRVLTHDINSRKMRGRTVQPFTKIAQPKRFI